MIEGQIPKGRGPALRDWSATRRIAATCDATGQLANFADTRKGRDYFGKPPEAVRLGDDV